VAMANMAVIDKRMVFAIFTLAPDLAMACSRALLWSLMTL
jgi:hypothetical protein